MSDRHLKAQHKWRGNPRFAYFFEHTKFGFTIRTFVLISAGLYVLVFALWLAGCSILSILFGAEAWKMCWKDGNPFVFGSILTAGWAPFVIHYSWTSEFRNRFKKAGKSGIDGINLDKGRVEDGSWDGGGS